MYSFQLRSPSSNNQLFTNLALQCPLHMGYSFNITCNYGIIASNNLQSLIMAASLPTLPTNSFIGIFNLTPTQYQPIRLIIIINSWHELIIILHIIQSTYGISTFNNDTTYNICHHFNTKC